MIVFDLSIMLSIILITKDFGQLCKPHVCLWHETYIVMSDTDQQHSSNGGNCTIKLTTKGERLVNFC